MLVYISGKITGLPIEEAKQKFAEAEAYLFSIGNTPVNPMKWVPFDDAKTWHDYMKEDIKLLLNCKAIYMLKNWQQSNGATIEHDLACKLGFVIMYQ